MGADRGDVRVLVVIDSMAQGGAEQSLAAVLPLVRASGIDAQVALQRSVAPEREEALRNSGVPVTVLEVGGPVEFAASLRRRLRSDRPDLLHLTLFEPVVFGSMAALGTGVPVLASIVNTPLVRRGTESGASGAAWKVRLAARAEGFACRHLVTHVHAVTEGVADEASEAMRVPRASITVAERGRDAMRFRPAVVEERHAARMELGIGSDRQVVVALGRHEPAKGFSVLIDAAEHVRSSMPGLLVLIAGRTGTETAAIIGQIERLGLGDHVRLLGDRADPERILAAGDLFVLSSRREGTSGAALEAMGMGLPVVATELDGLRGILVDGQNARTVPVGSAGALAAAMQEVLLDRDLARRLGAEGRAVFLDRFTLERSAASLGDLYRSVSARGR